MTSVTLQRMWLTNIVTTEMLGLMTAKDRPQEISVRGEVRIYGGGRSRSIARAGQSQTWQFELQEMTLAQVQTLSGWMNDGVTVLARDYRGQSMYGVFFSISVRERAQVNVYAAEVTMQSVSVVEGV